MILGTNTVLINGKEFKVLYTGEDESTGKPMLWVKMGQMPSYIKTAYGAKVSYYTLDKIVNQWEQDQKIETNRKTEPGTRYVLIEDLDEICREIFPHAPKPPMPQEKLPAPPPQKEELAGS